MDQDVSLINTLELIAYSDGILSDKKALALNKTKGTRFVQGEEVLFRAPKLQLLAALKQSKLLTTKLRVLE